MTGCPPLPPTSPHEPTAGWGLKGPLQIPHSHPPLPHGHHSSGCWVGHPHCEPPKEGQGNPARFCLTPLPQSPREQIKRSSDRDTKGLPEEPLCPCRRSPYPPLKHLFHLPCAAPSLTQELLSRSRGAPSTQSGVIWEDTRGSPFPIHSGAGSAPSHHSIPPGFLQISPHWPPVNGTGANWEGLLGTLGAAGQGQSDSRAGGTHNSPKISVGMETGVPAEPEAMGRGCSPGQLKSSVDREKGLARDWGFQGEHTRFEGRGTQPPGPLLTFLCR